LAKKLGFKKSQIELLSGETTHQKRFLIRGMDGKTLSERIAKAMDSLSQ
jgi:uncharacterized protein YggU (UPF0235/DUF167 family)